MDRDLEQSLGAHIPELALPPALQGGAPDFSIAVAVHYAQFARRCDRCRCVAYQRVP